ncbi:MAG: adenosylcobinamide-GDP ribazoletransferase, partial [Firmicutes bacterium]|nr:adenosylcobinamide-GDP ribazoletransferase [Bacillota bacterium]
AGAMLAAAIGGTLYVQRMSQRQFGGMSGDLAGYLLQLGELSMLAALVIIGKLV